LPLIAAIGAGAMAVTTHPSLPRATGFWAIMSERRYVIGALWIAAQSGFAQMGGDFLFLPTALAGWAITHAHPRIQASMDIWSLHTPRFKRWKLHAVILIATLILYYVIIAGLAMSNIDEDPLIAFSPAVQAAAIILILFHDAITARHVTVKWMDNYFIRVLAVIFLFSMPIFALLAFVILRSMGILYVAYRDAKSAKLQGLEWHDTGEGVATAVGNGSESSGFQWKWIIWIILALNFARIIFQSGG
jgi:hypothetical protein